MRYLHHCKFDTLSFYNRPVGSGGLGGLQPPMILRDKSIEYHITHNLTLFVSAIRFGHVLKLPLKSISGLKGMEDVKMAWHQIFSPEALDKPPPPPIRKFFLRACTRILNFFAEPQFS